MTLLAVMNKHCMFWYELVFVVGVTSYRWQHSQSDVVCRIKDCAMLTALKSFYRENGRKVIRFFRAIFSSYRNLPLTERAMRQ